MKQTIEVMFGLFIPLRQPIWLTLKDRDEVCYDRMPRNIHVLFYHRPAAIPKNQGDSSPKPNILIELFQALERKKNELAWSRASGGINILRFANFLHSDTLDASNNMSDTSDGDRLIPALHHTPLLPFLLLYSLRQIRCTS